MIEAGADYLMLAPEALVEQVRLLALREYGLLDTAPEETFDRLTRWAASFFQVAISLISLIDDRRQWFKSVYGIETRETPREYAFCGHTILGREVLIVEDALTDARFRDNPLVLGPPGIRFYAGAPVLTADNFALGAFCLIDRQPRTLDDTGRSLLLQLARLTAAHVELRRLSSELAPGRTVALP